MNNTQENKWLILIEEKEVVVSLLTDEKNLLVSEEKGWDGDDPESLIAGIDSGIGACLAKEEGISRPQKTIFILPPFWVSQEAEVLPSRKKILQRLCKQLNLRPEGFLVGEEVLSNFYTDFVSIYFGKEYLRFSIIKDKSLELQEELENGEDIDPEDVAVFLSQLNGKAIVPSQMVFWGRIQPGNKDRLLSHNWQESNLFDKPPEVKILSWSDFLQSTARVVQGEVRLEVIEEKSPQPPAGPVPVDSQPSKDKPKDDKFGFGSGDVAEKDDWQTGDQPKPKPQPESEADPEIQPQPKPAVEPKPKKPGLTGKLSKLPKLPRPNFSFISGRRMLILLLLPIILIAGLFLSWRFSSATVEIYVTPEELTEELSVSLDPGAVSLDLEKGIVPVEEVTVEKTGSKSQPATGEKLIGERAQGEVKVFNRTSEQAEFSAGTSLFGPNNLEFVLDNDVSVASKTADLNTGVDRWGETIASVTAANIGTDYNLAADSVFTIADFPEDDYLARNEEAFSGGTSRQIKAVSEDDQTKLRQTLTEDLVAEAEKDLEERMADSQIIEGSFSSTVIEEDFTAQVGDEVDSVGLDLTVEVAASRINQEQLFQIAETVLADKLEDGYQLKEESLLVKLDINEDSEEDLITGNLILKGDAYPRIEDQVLGQELAGQKEARAKELIRQSYPRIYRHNINYQFPWLKYFSYLPSKPENIIIKVEE